MLYMLIWFWGNSAPAGAALVGFLPLSVKGFNASKLPFMPCFGSERQQSQREEPTFMLYPGHQK